MAYHKPFRDRSPDFRMVEYEFTYGSEEAAAAAFALVTNKRYSVDGAGNFSLPPGHRLHARGETLSGNAVRFVGQIKAREVSAPSEETRRAELEIAGDDGTMTAKTVRQSA